MLAPLLSALGFAAAAGVAPFVVHPWPAGAGTASLCAVLALVMGVLAIEPSR